MKNFRNFHLKTFIFLVVKFSVYLNRRVFIMYQVFIRRENLNEMSKLFIFFFFYIFKKSNYLKC